MGQKKRQNLKQAMHCLLCLYSSNFIQFLDKQQKDLIASLSTVRPRKWIPTFAVSQESFCSGTGRPWGAVPQEYSCISLVNPWTTVLIFFWTGVGLLSVLAHRRALQDLCYSNSFCSAHYNTGFSLLRNSTLSSLEDSDWVYADRSN